MQSATLTHCPSWAFALIYSWKHMTDFTDTLWDLAFIYTVIINAFVLFGLKAGQSIQLHMTELG